MKDYIKLTVILAALTVLGGSAGCPPTPPPPAGPTCADVCQHWQQLGCEEAKPTPKGASCVEVCENIQAGSMPEDLKCQAAVASCDQIDDC
jgi:hypothetical protein